MIVGSDEIAYKKIDSKINKNYLVKAYFYMLGIPLKVQNKKMILKVVV